MTSTKEFLDEFEKIDLRTRQETIVETFKNLPAGKQAETLISAGKDLSTAEKEAVVAAFNPSQPVMDKIWLTIVYAFVFVLCGVFVGMMLSWFIHKSIDDKFITIFTASSAFLAGLLAPSPAKKQ